MNLNLIKRILTPTSKHVGYEILWVQPDGFKSEVKTVQKEIPLH